MSTSNKQLAARYFIKVNIALSDEDPADDNYHPYVINYLNDQNEIINTESVHEHTFEACKFMSLNPDTNLIEL